MKLLWLERALLEEREEKEEDDDDLEEEEVRSFERCEDERDERERIDIEGAAVFIQGMAATLY